jgi:hypothetical protein
MKKIVIDIAFIAALIGLAGFGGYMIGQSNNLNEFESVAELEDFVQDWNFRATLEADCDDMVKQFIRDASMEGYQVSAALDPVKYHYVACALIGNDFYFVDLGSKNITQTLNDMYWIRDAK